MVLAWQKVLGRCGVWGLVLGVSLLGLTGCKGGSGDDDDDDSGSSCSLPSNARGTETCHRWQSALCSFVARCGGPLDPCTCYDQASAISCISDALAGSCADALTASSCSAPPAGCDLGDMADPVPAQQGCQSFVDGVCNHDATCAGTPVDQCVADANAQINCSQAVGIKPKLDQCLAELSALACSASALPATCESAVLLSP